MATFSDTIQLFNIYNRPHLKLKIQKYNTSFFYVPLCIATWSCFSTDNNTSVVIIAIDAHIQISGSGQIATKKIHVCMISTFSISTHDNRTQQFLIRSLPIAHGLAAFSATDQKKKVEFDLPSSPST
jgi:hypothetical protein